MSDVRRVIVDSTKEILEEASGFLLEVEGTDFIVDDTSGTHALLPWEEYERLRVAADNLEAVLSGKTGLDIRDDEEADDE